MINFDQNAGLAIDPKIRERTISLFGGEANPSSIHQLGQKGKFLIENARREIKLALGAAEDDTLVFTSGATEANNHAIFGVYWKFTPSTEAHEVVSSVIEHPSVLEPIDRLEKAGWVIHRLAPTNSGSIDPNSLKPFLTERTKLVSLMYANNETGVINPISQVVQIVRQEAPRAIIHCDAVQAVGKAKVNFNELGVDLLTISGHKFGAMKGVGALLMRKGVSIPGLILGGPQEKHLRAGTENVWGIVSLGEALKIIREELDQRIAAMKSGVEFLTERLKSSIPWCNFNVEAVDLLPNTISLHLPGVDAADLVVGMDLKGVAISSGAACASGKPDPSHVILGMGLSPQVAKSSVRISIGPKLSPAELEHGCSTLISLASEMRK